MSSSWDLPNPGITPRSPTLQADSSLSEPPGKPKNPGVGSLPLLQETFPTQGSNWGLLHCRWVLYHLSHPGSPLINESDVIIDITILLLANCKNFDFYVYVDFQDLMIKNTLLVKSTIHSLLECFECILCYTYLQLKLENSVTALTKLNVIVPTLFHLLQKMHQKDFKLYNMTNLVLME